MGFKQQELVPFQDPSPITPASKVEKFKVMQVNRTDTTNVVKMVIPAQASILSLNHYRNGNSNAATTGGYTVTVSNNSGVIATGTYSTQTLGDTTGTLQVLGLPNIEPLPLNGDLTIRVQYAETGTASTAGGPWTIGVRYVD